MKIYLEISILFLFFLSTRINVRGDGLKKQEELAEGRFKYFFYPLCHLNTKEYAITLDLLKLLLPIDNITGKNVKFVIYTRENPEKPEVIRGDEQISKLKTLQIDFSREIVLFCNGYFYSSYQADIIFPRVLLQQKDYIFINVDWDSYAFYNPLYTSNVTVPILGSIIGDFLKKLVCVGADPKNITLLGFSMGSQAMGLAAKKIHPKIARIIAYSPDASCFDFVPDSQRLVIGDADFLVMVHCSSGILEYSKEFVGNTTFYINGGIVQPECELVPTTLLQNTCSHNRCLNYLHDSLSNTDRFVGVKCQTYEDYEESKCDCGDRVALTLDIPNSTKGLYFIDTSLSTKNPCPVESA